MPVLPICLAGLLACFNVIPGPRGVVVVVVVVVMVIMMAMVVVVVMVMKLDMVMELVVQGWAPSWAA